MDGWWGGYKFSSCSEKIYHQPCPHFNGHWKIPASFNTNLILPLGSGTSPKVFVSCHVFGIGELTFHFLAAHYIFLLHLFPDVPSISWCSEYLLQLRAQSSVETHTTDSLYSLTSYLLANMFPLFKELSDKILLFQGYWLLFMFFFRFLEIQRDFLEFVEVLWHSREASRCYAMWCTL